MVGVIKETKSREKVKWNSMLTLAAAPHYLSVLGDGIVSIRALGIFSSSSVKGSMVTSFPGLRCRAALRAFGGCAAVFWSVGPSVTSLWLRAATLRSAPFGRSPWIALSLRFASLILAAVMVLLYVGSFAAGCYLVLAGFSIV